MNYGTPSSVGSTRSGARGTPVQVRPDVRTDRRVRQLPIIQENVSREFIW